MKATCFLIPSKTGHFGLVRVVGVEPTRLAAQEPKGDVTLVKDFLVIRYHHTHTVGAVSLIGPFLHVLWHFLYVRVILLIC